MSQNAEVLALAKWAAEIFDYFEYMLKTLKHPEAAEVAESARNHVVAQYQLPEVKRDYDSP